MIHQQLKKEEKFSIGKNNERLIFFWNTKEFPIVISRNISLFLIKYNF